MLGWQDIVEACNGLAECDLFVYNPLGRSLDDTRIWATSAFVKTARSPDNSSKLMQVLPLQFNVTAIKLPLKVMISDGYMLDNAL